MNTGRNQVVQNPTDKILQTAAAFSLNIATFADLNTVTHAPHPSRIPALDGVRGLATLMVLCSHFVFADLFGNKWWWAAIHGGWMGVDLFFVLSGFLITGILLDKKGKPRYFQDFYRRRALRIFPLYYFSLILAAFAITVVDQEPWRLWDGYNGLQWYLAFIPNFALAWAGEWTWQTNWVGLAHLWSLAVEEQFYILWPLVVLLTPRKVLGLLCIVLLCAGVYLRKYTDGIYGEWSIASYVLPYCRMDGLAAGSLLAVLWREGWLTFSELRRSLVRDLTVGLAMITFYYLIAGNSHWRGTSIALMFLGFTYLALCQTGTVRRVCENAFLRHIGTYSYGLYIFHQMFRMPYEWCFKGPLLATGMPLALVQIIYILLAFSATYGFARLSWKFIEKPFLDRK